MMPMRAAARGGATAATRAGPAASAYASAPPQSKQQSATIDLTIINRCADLPPLVLVDRTRGRNYALHITLHTPHTSSL